MMCLLDGGCQLSDTWTGARLWPPSVLTQPGRATLPLHSGSGGTAGEMIVHKAAGLHEALEQEIALTEAAGGDPRHARRNGSSAARAARCPR
jgi:hypothetical protein